MYDNLKTGVTSIKNQQVHEPGSISIWVPQFKLSNPSSRIFQDEKLINFKVQDSVEQTFVQDYKTESAIQLNGGAR